jgi:hypothetical protein
MADSAHERLINAAEKAIDALFSDMTVSQQTTLDDLEELRGEIDFKCVALKEDMRRKERDG